MAIPETLFRSMSERMKRAFSDNETRLTSDSAENHARADLRKAAPKDQSPLSGLSLAVFSNPTPGFALEQVLAFDSAFIRQKLAKADEAILDATKRILIPACNEIRAILTDKGLDEVAKSSRALTAARGPIVQLDTKYAAIFDEQVAVLRRAETMAALVLNPTTGQDGIETRGGDVEQVAEARRSEARKHFFPLEQAARLMFVSDAERAGNLLVLDAIRNDPLNRLTAGERIDIDHRIAGLIGREGVGFFLALLQDSRALVTALGSRLDAVKYGNMVGFRRQGVNLTAPLGEKWTEAAKIVIADSERRTIAVE